MGCTTRLSTSTKAKRSATPDPMLATAAAEAQPQSGASITPKISTAIPTVDRARPPQSIGGVLGSREVGIAMATRAAIAPATMAMNTKMLPHQNRSRSHPPTIGPVAMPIPVVAPQSPIAMARSPRSVNTLTSSESVEGNMSAAPSPINALEAISSAEVADPAPARLANAKTASPMSSVPLRPNRSLKLPAASTSAANTRL